MTDLLSGPEARHLRAAECAKAFQQTIVRDALPKGAVLDSIGRSLEGVNGKGRKGGFRHSCWGASDRYSPDGLDLESAMEMLKKRYAKGEPTKEEFELMKRDILSGCGRS
ncbi:MAG TPA: hypothetical protein DCZ97_13300 [Syntrophus sp. (in: bacteria)]|nr:hypothetical protein [Syntrophus sp. (in: bacteria)]